MRRPRSRCSRRRSTTTARSPTTTAAAAAEASGLPEAAVYGVSTFYDDLLSPRGARHVRVCTGTACFAATGDAHVDRARATALGLELGERTRGRRALARRDGLPRLLPLLAGGPRRRRDRRRARRGRARARRQRRARRAEPEWQQRARRAGADPARRLVRAAPRARRARRPRSCSTRSRRPSVRGRGGAGLPGRARSGSSRATPPASRSSSSPTATRATPAPTSTST